MSKRKTEAKRISLSAVLAALCVTARRLLGENIAIKGNLDTTFLLKQSPTEVYRATQAILQSGAIRMRPILLTAATTALGAWPITLDPIFSGLAWTLIFGLLASTVFTLVVIPVTYYALYRNAYDGA